MKIKPQKILILDNDAPLRANSAVCLERWRHEKNLCIKKNIGVLLSSDDDLFTAVDTAEWPFVVVDFSNFDNGSAYSQISILRRYFQYQNEIGAIYAHEDHLSLMQDIGVDWFQTMPSPKKVNHLNTVSNSPQDGLSRKVAPYQARMVMSTSYGH